MMIFMLLVIIRGSIVILEDHSKQTNRIRRTLCIGDVDCDTYGTCESETIKFVVEMHPLFDGKRDILSNLLDRQLYHLNHVIIKR